MNALAFLWLTRKLGSEAFGHLSLAIAANAYFLLFVQQGFEIIAIRQVARRRLDLLDCLENLLGLRLGLAALAASGVAIYSLMAARNDPAAWLLLILSTLYPLAALSVRWAFLALENLKAPAIAVIVSQAVFLAGCLLVRRPEQAGIAAAAMVLGEFVATAFLWRAFRRIRGGARPRLDLLLTRTLFAESWPVTCSLFLGAMLYNFDVVALRLLGHEPEIGVYTATYRLITIFGPLLGALQSVIYPGLANAWLAPGAVLSRVLRLAAGTVVALGVAAISFHWLAGDLLSVLYGEPYRAGSGFLRVLVWVLPIQGLRVVLRQIVLAWGKPLDDLRNLALAATVNVTLDLALVPGFGALGCSWSTLCAEGVLLVGSLLTAIVAIRSRRAPGGVRPF